MYHINFEKMMVRKILLFKRCNFQVSNVLYNIYICVCIFLIAKNSSIKCIYILFFYINIPLVLKEF